MRETNDGLETFKRWKVGEITITRVLEMPTLRLDPAWLLKATTEDVRGQEWLYPVYATREGELLANIQAFIVEAGGKRIMVDPCAGNGKKRESPLFNMLDNPFLERLTAAGFPRESIDFVLCTHLHTDHCGWNTMLVDGKWVPTFPNARYLFARTEFEHARVETMAEQEATFEDSVTPIVEAGLAELIEFDHHIAEGIRLEPTPGHTAGHCSIVISSGGQEAIISGDVIHHPLQAVLPGICSNYCLDDEQAISSRKAILGRIADGKTMLLGTHFPEPTGVYVTSEDGAWKVIEA